MTITLALKPQEEARLVAIAHSKGLSADAFVREALDEILADTTAIPEEATGAALVTVMQESPFKEVDLEAARDRLPVRDVVF